MRPVLFCGDPHGRFEQIIRAAHRFPEAPVVLLGDLQPNGPLHEILEPIWSRVWWIHGNHDTDDDLGACRVFYAQAQERSLHGRVQAAGGVRLAGLGGVFRAQVWYPREGVGQARWSNPRQHAQSVPRRDRWQDGPPRKHWSSLYPHDLQNLARQRCDILVLHEAPGYHQHGFLVLDEVARAMGARVVVHGHQHDNLDSRAAWAKQGFASFGVGLRGVSLIDVDANCQVIEPGECDALHATQDALVGRGFT